MKYLLIAVLMLAGCCKPVFVKREKTVEISYEEFTVRNEVPLKTELDLTMGTLPKDVKIIDSAKVVLSVPKKIVKKNTVKVVIKDDGKLITTDIGYTISVDSGLITASLDTLEISGEMKKTTSTTVEDKTNMGVSYRRYYIIIGVVLALIAFLVIRRFF